MEITLNNRLCILIGPTTSGKTTLSKRIKDEFSENCKVISHDGVLSKIPKNQSQNQIDFQFRITLLKEIASALEDTSNKLVVLDTINILHENFTAFVMGLRALLNYNDEITILKMDVDLSLRQEFWRQRIAMYKALNMNDMLSAMDSNALFQQGALFKSNVGSLRTQLPSTRNFIINDPTKVKINFDMPISKVKR